ncbi:MAG: hypothetical protein L3K26_19155 [Candidatus Hydrogenedentes bacterium]|nr:hypothetical protein [Candidatus Hydrogenedentota bacterium]
MKTLSYLLAAIGLMFIGALAGDLLSHPNRGIVSCEPIPVAPLATQVIGHNSAYTPDVVRLQQANAIQTFTSGNAAMSWAGVLKLLLLAAITLLSFAVITGMLIGLKRLLRSNKANDNVNSGTVQELYHFGKNLDKRMEALETILLERSRPIS